MIARRLVSFAAALALAATGLAASTSTAAATTTTSCGGGGVFQSTSRRSGIGLDLTAVQASLDKQSVPLCPNPGPAQWSASSWWVMIEQPPNTTNDYIQYGFWNCAVGCGVACCHTSGEVHEFWERNNGNVSGHYRVDLGSVTSANYPMLLEWRWSGYSWFNFTRNGVLQAQSSDDGWRDWSLDNAKFTLSTETWNIGDQNGGQPANKVLMKAAKWGRDQGAIFNTGMPPCVIAPSNPNGAFGCESYSINLGNDSVRAWTNDR